MAKRKVYLKKYEKAIAHIKCNSKIEEQYLNEIQDCMRNIKRIKGAYGTESYFNHIDFILKDTFGIEVEGVKEAIK